MTILRSITMKKLSFILVLFLFSSCEIQYGMLDTSIDADSFTVDIFEEQAANAPAGYGIDFTEFLRVFLVSRSKMKLKTDEADIQISGKIRSYYTEAAAIQTDDAALNSLKVTIEVTVVNNRDEKQSFEETFYQISNYESSTDFNSVENELLEDINEKLSQDILSELSKNW
jgi:hypothetical protein